MSKKSNMPDRINLLGNVDKLHASPQVSGYTRVTLMIDDDQEITVGTDTGQELRVFCPWGNRTMAENILASIKGYQYQPYEAAGAWLDPAAELMDGVTIDQIYGGIYTMETDFGPDFIVDLEAPEDPELNKKNPYRSPRDRKITRKFKHQAAELRVNTKAIEAEVLARTEEGQELRSTLAVHADQISAKVEKTGGKRESFSWEMQSDHHAWYANGSEIARLSKAGLRLTGEIRAKTGSIGGFEILRDSLSYNSQTWGGSNSRGIYMGSSGFQLGSWDSGFHVNNQGRLFAGDGEFRGSVRAGRISYGGNDGHVSGEALYTHSVRGGYGGHIAGGSVSSYSVTGGINNSLGNADYAADVVRGYQTAQEMSCNKMTVVSNLKFRGSYVYIATINGQKVLSVG